MGRTDLFDKKCGNNTSNCPDASSNERRESIGIIFKELNIAKYGRILIRWARKSTYWRSQLIQSFLYSQKLQARTNERAHENADIV
jgi:hypothetical protein